MRVLDSMVLTGNDLKAVNSFETPDKVIPRKLEKPSTSAGRATFEVPPRSYSVIHLSV